MIHPTDIRVKEQEHPNYVAYEIYEKAILENSQLTNRITFLEDLVKEKDEVIANGMKVEFNTASLLHPQTRSEETNCADTDGSETGSNTTTQSNIRYTIDPADDLKIWRLLAKAHKINYINVPNPSTRTVLTVADFGQEQ